MRLTHCTYLQHGQAILAIINEAILTSTAIYDYQPRTLPDMESWFAIKNRNAYPVIGAEDDAGNLMGFASYGIFRAWPAYKYTVEHSIYVHQLHRRQGLAQRLMEELLVLARQQGMHAVIGCIDMENCASIELHEKLGFEQCGILREVGFKFGRWLDVGLYQLILETPDYPVDDSDGLSAGPHRL